MGIQSFCSRPQTEKQERIAYKKVAITYLTGPEPNLPVPHADTGTMPVTAGIIRNLSTAVLRADYGMSSQLSAAAMADHMKSLGLLGRHGNRSLNRRIDMIKNLFQLRHRRHRRPAGFAPQQSA